MNEKNYAAFLESKRERVEPVGFDVPDARISSRLFDWQAKIVQDEDLFTLTADREGVQP